MCFTTKVRAQGFPAFVSEQSVCLGDTKTYTAYGFENSPTMVMEVYNSSDVLIETIDSVSSVIEPVSSVNYKKFTFTKTWATSGTYTVKVRETSFDGCEGEGVDVLTVTVNDLPSVPTGDASQAFCGSATVANLDATSSETIDWYLVATGGSPLSTADALSTGNYYAEARNATTGCVSSSRLLVAVTINPLPDVPTGDASQAFCGSATVANLDATSSETIDWYLVATGGSPLSTADALSTGNYYAEARNATTGCVSSSRLLVAVTINPLPDVPTGDASQAFCGSATVANLDATSSETIDWYLVAIGGSPLSTSAVLADGITYYAEARNTTTGCVSSGRLAVSVSTLPNTTITLSSAIGTDYQTLCENTSIDDITYNVNNATGVSITAGSFPAGVSESYSGGGFTISGTPSEIGVFPYTITATGDCGDVEMSGTITVKSLPAITITDDFAICSGEIASLSVDDPNDYSMKFDGVNDYLTIPNSNSINTSIVSVRTIMFWFRPENTSDKQVMYEEGGGTNGLAIYLENNKVYATYWNDKTIVSTVSADINSNNEWSHLSMTINTNDLFKLYLNGKLVGQVASGADLKSHSGDICIGRSISTLASIGSGNYFAGNIDNFRLWNSVFDQSQIIAQMSAESTSGAIVDYSFDDQVSSVTNNGSAGNATITGAVYESDHTILWSPGGATKFNVDVTPVVTTTYKATLTNETGCAVSDEVIVTVHDLPTPTISGALSVCAEDPETPLDPDLINTEIYFTETGMSNYNWTVTGGTIEAGDGTNEITVKWKTAGTGTVSVNYKNTNGCSATSAKSETITIYERPNPSSIFPDN